MGYLIRKDPKETNTTEYFYNMFYWIKARDLPTFSKRPKEYARLFEEILDQESITMNVQEEKL